jgi:hypothetical protein
VKHPIELVLKKIWYSDEANVVIDARAFRGGRVEESVMKDSAVDEIEVVDHGYRFLKMLLSYF